MTPDHTAAGARDHRTGGPDVGSDLRSDRSLDLDLERERRHRLRVRHSRALTALMRDRSDLRGVHALADFVDDAVRWSA